MRHTKSLIPTFLMFFSLACTSGAGFPFSVWGTATPVAGIEFEVSVIYPTPTPAPVFVAATPAATETPTSTLTISTAQAAALTSTLAIAATEAASASGQVPPPTLEPTFPPAEPVTVPVAVTEPVTPTQAITTVAAPLDSTAQVQMAPPPAPFALLEPVQEFALQPGINELEFKWRWTTEQSCQPPEGFGYELRIWPAVSGYGPMGVIDAVANQQNFSCDPNSNVASYRVDDLKGTPGVAAMGSGKFLWDVAYIQLDPYTVMMTSGPRLFEIP